MSPVAALISHIDAVASEVRAVPGVQVESSHCRESMRELASEYFTEVQPLTPGGEVQSVLEQTFQDLHRSSHGRPRKARCIELLRKAKAALVELEGLTLVQRAKVQAGHRTRADELIVSTLRDICPSAALAYEQALADFETTRLSWRGPATDLREALRETLDVLAPDGEVEAQPGYRPEPDAKRPTMKQKVRFILKNRGIASGAMATPETAVNGIEEIVGGLTRSVYNRSSVSTHTPTDKSEVLRVHAWVRIVLCELLELPP